MARRRGRTLRLPSAHEIVLRAQLDPGVVGAIAVKGPVTPVQDFGPDIERTPRTPDQVERIVSAVGERCSRLIRLVVHAEVVDDARRPQLRRPEMRVGRITPIPVSYT